MQEAPASSAGTFAPGSAGEPTMPAAGRRQTGRLMTAGAVAAALLAMLAVALYRNAATDPPRTTASTGSQPPVLSAPTPTNPTASDDRRAINERLDAIRATARRQVAAGQRPQLLDTVSAGLVLDGGDRELNGLIDELKGGARQLAAQAKANASRAGATEATSIEFRDGRARERDGEAHDRSGDRAQAIRALWAAAESYDRASRATAQSAALPAGPAPAAPHASPPVAKVEPMPPPPERQPAPAPPPAPSVDKPPQPPLAVRPDPSTTTAPAEIARDARANDIAAIQDTLRRYADAYRSRDIAAVGKVLPSLNAQQLRSLDKDFSNYRSYSVEVADPRIVVDRDTATASSPVTRSFVTRNGVAGGHTVATTFHMRRVEGAWVIERLESR
jgi:hypothetical protein